MQQRCYLAGRHGGRREHVSPSTQTKTLVVSALDQNASRDEAGPLLEQTRNCTRLHQQGKSGNFS